MSAEFKTTGHGYLQAGSMDPTVDENSPIDIRMIYRREERRLEDKHVIHTGI